VLNKIAHDEAKLKQPEISRVERIEQYVSATPEKNNVIAWRVKELDLWPLFATCLLSLAILIDIRQIKGRISVGGAIWRAGVRLDHTLISPFRRWTARRQDFSLPPDQLEDAVLYVASKVQARMLDDLLVSAPLDIPATLMHRAGHKGVTWFEDMFESDARLGQALNPPARGIASIMSAARAQAFRSGTRKGLRKIPGFPDWCANAASCLGLSSRFLETWLARQVNIALATREHCGLIFDQRGSPKLLVMLNSGFASTVGLTAAAKIRDIRVVEIHHGAESKSAVTAPGSKHHFSVFNSAPDSLVSWELDDRGDRAVLPVGPVGLHLLGVFEKQFETDKPPHKALGLKFQAQRKALDVHARQTGLAREILVSLQPGDSGNWLKPVVKALPDCLFWVRRHGADSHLSYRDIADINPRQIEVDLASSSILPLLLDRVDLHLTRFSAVTLEAAAWGVPTLATEMYARKLYHPTVDADLLHIEVENFRIADAIKRQLQGKREKNINTLPSIGRIAPFLESYIKTGVSDTSSKRTG